MREIIVKKNQSLLDIALQEYGHVVGVFDIVERNALSGITDNVYEHERLEVSKTPISGRIKGFLSTHTIATLAGEHERACGIGWMEIERNFRIT